MEERNYSSDGKVINLRTLYFYVLKKYKVLLIFLVIGLVLGAAFSGYKMYQGNCFSCREVCEENINMEKVLRYSDYMDLYNTQCDYMDSSYYLNMDPSLVFDGSESFFLRVEGSDAHAVGEAYRNVVRYKDAVQRMIEAAGIDMTEGEFLELFTSSYSQSDNQYLEMDETSGILEISFIYDDEETVEKVLSEAEKIILSYQPEGKATVTALGSMVSRKFNVSLKKAQEEAAAARENYRTAAENAKKNLSEDDLFYYENVILDEDKRAELETIGFSKKWPVLFAVLFLFVVLAWYVFKFILSSRMLDESELKSMYGLDTLAALPSEKGTKGFLKKIEKSEDKFRMPAGNVSYALSAMKLAAGENGLLIADMEDEEAKETAEKFASLCDSIEIANLLSKSPEAQEAAMEKGSATILVHMNMMLHSTLQRELDILKMRNVKVNGVVILR